MIAFPLVIYPLVGFLGYLIILKILACLKFSKPGFNSTWTMNFQMFKLDLDKTEETDQIANIHCIIEKAREFQKTCTSALLTMPKHLTVWNTTNCGKFWKGWEHQTTWPASWEICMQVRKQELEPNKEQWISSKLEKEYIKAGSILSPCLFNFYAEYIMYVCTP